MSGMNNKLSNLILEIIWIITGILCISAGIFSYIKNGYGTRIILFAAMALISFLFAWFRHNQRKKK